MLNSISGTRGPEDSAIRCRFSKKIHINWKIASLRLNDLRSRGSFLILIMYPKVYHFCVSRGPNVFQIIKSACSYSWKMLLPKVPTQRSMFLGTCLKVLPYPWFPSLKSTTLGVDETKHIHQLRGLTC